MAGTRAGGLHRVRVYAQEQERRRETPVEWEAGDVELVERGRPRGGGGAAGAKGGGDAGGGAWRKADGTLDRRFKVGARRTGVTGRVGRG